jgi:sugar lactone lactonase YvrE
MSNNKDFKVKNGIQPTVYQEGVGTVVSGSVGYNLAGASYDSVSFSVAAQDTVPFGITFNNDGTKLYMVGIGTQAVYQYSLSTSFDLSTASYNSVSFSVISQDNSPRGVVFNTSGTKMYMVGAATGNVYQYSLSTAFDLSTASYDSVSFNVVNPAVDAAYSLAFNNDGTKMYVSSGLGSVYQYSLSTAFDLSTASYDSVSFSVAGQETPSGIVFTTDGTKMYAVGSVTDTVYQYSLSTAFDLSTTSYDSVSFSVAGQEVNPYDLAFNSDGTKMYIVGATNDTIYQYSTVLTTASLDLSSGSVFDYTPTSDVQVTLTNPAASGTSSGATLLLGAEDATGVGSTFSTTLYTGTGANQTITNGLDLAGDGGLTWIKRRNAADSHVLTDSERGYGQVLNSDTTGANQNLASLFNLSTTSSGFTVGSNNTQINNNAQTYVSWSFKKQTKFFDIVTYTGDGTTGRQISHNLGGEVGTLIIKKTNATGSWIVYHRSLGTSQYMALESTSQALNFSAVNTVTSTYFVSDNQNASGSTYVAYLFAHDTDASSLIQCGSFTTDGSGNVGSVELGWEPQWVLTKRTDTTQNWYTFDTMRGYSVTNLLLSNGNWFCWLW